ncbi:LamG-like jellyroll fold domain-containing protein [Micromonospora sp. NPDC092111]|uniref:LamG-like jellyroll fold domain-containing protein n=1 Tax=Micromonospora sp. NPDC092111 TaxID=3364289 RepID=UPI003830D570
MTRRRLWLLCGLVLAVIVAGLTFPRSPASTAPGSGVVVGPPAAPPAVPAAVRAARSGTRVELPEQTTATRQVFVNPDGTFTAEISQRPERVRRGEDWVPVDTRLRARPDGTVAPVAAAGLTLSGGGSTPLATLAVGGGRLELSWPAPLPAPVLVGETATYVDVLPGVDLRVQATATGFTHVLVVRTAEAARQPALRRYSFGLRTTKLTAKRNAAGGLLVTDRAGRTVLSSGSAWMWDSTTAADGSDRANRRAPIALELTGDRLTLVPDPALLLDPAVRFPLYLDPELTSGQEHWLMVQKDLPNQNWWDSTQFRPQVGRDPRESSTDRFRSYFEMDTSGVAGRDIIEAEFSIPVTWSWSCTKEPLHLFHTAPITSAMNWTTAPPLLADRRLATATEAYGGEGTGCQVPNDIELTATRAVAEAASVRARTLTLGLASDESSGANGAKEFLPQAKLTITYNNVPEAPELGGCTDNSAGYLTSDQPTLTAVPLDGDWEGQVLSVAFQWADSAGRLLGEAPGNQAVLSGNPVTARISTVLTEGATYQWRARTQDSRTAGPWSAWCRFVLDAQPPVVAPTVTSPIFVTDGVAGRTYEPGEVRFGANGAADVVAFRYSVNEKEQPDAPAVSGQARVQVTPTRGHNTLRVRGVDRAGLLGPETSFDFETDDTQLTPPVANWSMEDYGSEAWDVPGGIHNATLTGAATFGAGRGSGGLELDGSEQTYARTAGPVVRTDASFTAMAWVKLTRDDDWFTALGQSGVRFPGFELEYNLWPRGWVFEMATSDSTDSQVPVNVAAASGITAQLDVWTHLTGVYDHQAGQLRLYVNGTLAGTAAHRSTWNATGPVNIGSGYWHGAHPARWAGSLDDVRIFARVTSEAEIREVMAGEPWGPEARWHLEETEGRTAVDETGNTHTLAVATTGQPWGPGRNGGGLHLDGDGDMAWAPGPVVRTDRSFTAAAWVKLTRDDTTGTVLSQDGKTSSGFTLRYDAGARRWSFAMARADAADGQFWPAVHSAVAPVLNEWTHLAGVYDHDQGQLRLYVNGALSGTLAHRSTWNAAGQSLIGRGRNNGWHVEWWAGAIDEPVLTAGALSQGEIFGLLGDNLEGSGGEWDFEPEPTGMSTMARMDRTGNRHSITIGPGVDRTVAGYGTSGKGLGFDGTGGYASTAGPVVRTTESFTVAAWVKLTDVGGRRVAVSQQATQSSGFSLEYSQERNRWAFTVPHDDRSMPSMDRVSTVVSTAAPQLGIWTHLTGVYDKAASQLRLYVNGRLAGVPQTHTRPWSARGPLQIGRAWWNGGWQAPWKGVVDQVRVLDRAAGIDEVRALAGIAAPPEPGPLRLFAQHANLCLGENPLDTVGHLFLTACRDAIPDLSFQLAGDDLYRIMTAHPQHGTGCTGVVGNSTAVGARLENDYCVDRKPERLTRFRLIPVFGPTLHGHLVKVEHSGLCVGVAGNATAPGSVAVQLTCDPSAPGQVFDLQRVPDDGMPAPGATQIRSVHSGLCVGEVPGDPNHLLQQASCATASPPMRVEAAGQGRYWIKSTHPVNGVGCTLVLSPTTAVGSAVADGACPADVSAAHRFRLEPVSAPLAGYLIRPLQSGHCLGIVGSSTTAGARLVQQACDPTARGQVFEFRPPGTAP